MGCCRRPEPKNQRALPEGIAIPVRKTDLRRLAVLGALAMEMAFSVLAGTVFGYVLDEIFETAPVLTIVFLFVGLTGGVVAFVKLWTLLREKV
jgi:F0F1-type ATP synthase assembly protein I